MNQMTQAQTLDLKTLKAITTLLQTCDGLIGALTQAFKEDKIYQRLIGADANVLVGVMPTDQPDLVMYRIYSKTGIFCGGSKINLESRILGEGPHKLSEIQLETIRDIIGYKANQALHAAALTPLA